MLETLYLVLKDDLVYYPPVLSILHVCAEAGRPVVFIGNYADDEGLRVSKLFCIFATEIETL